MLKLSKQPKTLIKLNLGCGSQKIPGFIGIDCEKKAKPDVLCDFTKGILPYKDQSVDEIVCFHTIEHISKSAHGWIFNECFRVLKVGGKLIFSYPNFWVCAQHWKANFQGKKDYWHACLFGMQQYPSDFHVCAIDPDELSYQLQQFGFEGVSSTPEKLEPYNSVTVAFRGKAIKMVGYEQLVAKDFNETRVQLKK